MRNPKLAALLIESVDENRKEKVCLIEDIMKLKKHLFGLGDMQHTEWMNPDSTADLFWDLNELDMCALRIINKDYETRANLLMLNRMKALV